MLVHVRTRFATVWITVSVIIVARKAMSDLLHELKAEHGGSSLMATAL
jgi:hypothetical protein